MTFIAGLPEVDRDEATDDRQEDEMKDPITYRVNADRLICMALELSLIHISLTKVITYQFEFLRIIKITLLLLTR